MTEELFARDPARIVRIANQLTAIRLRGLEELDAPTGGEQPEDYPDVQALAEARCRAVGEPIYGRAAAIYLLFQAAIPMYGVWGNPRGGQVLDVLYLATPERVATLLREMNAAPEGLALHYRPAGRLKAARRLTGLDDKRFTEYQRQLLLNFASFLISFVEDTVREVEARHTAAAGTAFSTASAGPMRHSLALLTTILAAGLVAIALVLAALPLSGVRPSTTPVTITGYAKCWPDPTKPVVGVWIVAGNGGSGWADVRPLPGQANVAWFSHTLPNGGSYIVHVGCGGSPAHWELGLASLTGVVGSGHTFTCYDLPPARDPARARCQP